METINEKPIKAIFIDAENQNVSEIGVENSDGSIKSFLNCLNIQRAGTFGTESDSELLVCLNANVSGTKYGFYYNSKLFYGNGIIIGIDDKGGYKDVTITADSVDIFIMFN